METKRRSIWHGLLCLTVLMGVASLFFADCVKEHPELDITLEADFRPVIDAILDANVALTDKLLTIDQVLSDGLANRQTAIELVRKAVESLDGTMAQKLAAIETAVQAQATSLETKLAVIEAAVQNGFADAATQQDLLRQAIGAMEGTAEEKFAKIKEALDDRLTSLETKLGLVEAAVTAGFADSRDAQALIRQAIESLDGTVDEKISAIEAALQSRTADLSAKLALIETALKEGFAQGKTQQELVQQAIESLEGTMDEKLAALEEAMKSRTSGLEMKLEAIEAATESGLADVTAKLGLIQQAVASLGGDMGTKLDAVKEAVNSQTTSLETKLGLIEAAVNGGAGDTDAKLDLIQQAIESSGSTTDQKLQALQDAVSGLSSSLDTKLAAIQSAVSEGIASVSGAIGLIQQAVSSLSGNVGTVESNLTTQIGEVVTALSAIQLSLTSGEIKTVLDDILSAVQGLSDYSEILAAIQTALKDLPEALFGSPKQLSVWYHPNVSFKVKYKVSLEDGAIIERDSLCSVYVALDKPKKGKFEIENLTDVKFVPAADTTAPLTVGLDIDKHFVRFHPDTTESTVWQAFQCSTGTKHMDVNGYLVMADRRGSSDTLEVNFSWYNTVWYVQELWARVSEIGDATSGYYGSFEIDASDILRDCGLDEDKMLGCRCILSDNNFESVLTGYKKMDARFLGFTRIIEFNLKDYYEQGDDFSVDGLITLLILPSENDPLFKPQQLQINFRYILHITP